jgi:small subunit ribosomal protein S18
MAGKKSRMRRPAPPELKRQKKNPLEALGVTTIDYDTHRLRTFISDRGKIRRVTGLSPQQRQVAIAIKNAREMALLPSVEN